MNQIEAAVNPLKQDAIARATEKAHEIIQNVMAELAKVDFDLEKVAPYPQSWNASREQYHAGLSKYKLYRAFTKSRKGSRSMKEPDYCDIDGVRVTLFVENAQKNAAAQYDAFVAKLNAKIGEVTEATLTGNHVWGYSHLYVTKIDGTKECWKTQMIVNVSKLGLMFNQFPTRKVKH